MKRRALWSALFFILSLNSAFALNPDFFNLQKKKAKAERLRLKEASRYTKNREKALKAKEKKAKSYDKVRRKQEKELKRREKLFAKELNKQERKELRAFEQANRYAKAKRKKEKRSDWKSQNLEYGIEIQKVKIKKKETRL